MYAAPVHSKQKLNQPVRHELVQRQELLVGFGYRISVPSRSNTGSRFQGGGCLANHRILQGFTGNFPESDESIDCIRETDSKDAVVAGRAQRLEIEIEGPVEPVRTEQHQHIQPIERVDQADGDIHIVVQTVSVVDVEMPKLPCQESPS